MRAATGLWAIFILVFVIIVRSRRDLLYVINLVDRWPALSWGRVTLDEEILIIGPCFIELLELY